MSTVVVFSAGHPRQGGGEPFVGGVALRAPVFFTGSSVSVFAQLEELAAEQVVWHISSIHSLSLSASPSRLSALFVVAGVS